jgi:hypothetical protein
MITDVRDLVGAAAPFQLFAAVVVVKLLVEWDGLPESID